MPALPFVALAYAAGCLVGAVVGAPWWMAAGCMAVAILSISAFAHRRLDMAVVLAAAAFLITGQMRFEAAAGAPPSALAALSGRHAVIAIAQGDATVKGPTGHVD